MAKQLNTKMETELLTRDYQKPPPLKERLIKAVRSWLVKNQNKFQKLKEPKILTIIALTLTLIVTMLAISIVTSTKTKTPDTNPLQVPLVVKPATPSPQVFRSEIDLEIQNFVNELEENQANRQQLKQPIVDLDLNFN